MGTKRCVTKDFHKLLRTIDSLSAGQAKIVINQDCEDTENYERFVVEIAPSDGLYKGGKFQFEITIDADDWPATAPVVKCLTPIYHPNIDNYNDCFDHETNVCVSLLDEWEPVYGLDDLIQAILFLFYEPNVDDPLSSFGETNFEENARNALKGGTIEGYDFEPNYGWIENNANKSFIQETVEINFDVSGAGEEKQTQNELSNLVIDGDKVAEETETNRGFTKDFYKLTRSIDNFSAGHAKILVKTYLDVGQKYGNFVVEISPSYGLYKGFKFKFKITTNTASGQDKFSDQRCLIHYSHKDPDICLSVSLLEERKHSFGFDDIIRTFLSLLHQSNITNAVFKHNSMCSTKFEEQVRHSLKYR